MLIKTEFTTNCNAQLAAATINHNEKFKQKEVKDYALCSGVPINILIFIRVAIVAWTIIISVARKNAGAMPHLNFLNLIEK